MSSDASMAPSSSSPTVLSRDEGEVIRLGAVTIFVKEDGSRTRGTLGLAEFRGKGFRIPPHAHGAHDETLYLLEGELNITLGGETFGLKAGDALTFPLDVAHTTWHDGDSEARFLVQVSPARALDYFRDLGVALGAAAREGRPPAPDDFRPVMQRYGYKPGF